MGLGGGEGPAVGGEDRRAAGARRTQERVVEAGRRLLLERGYAGMAMADLAAEAGVLVPLLYKVFGTKPQLVKRVYDVLLALGRAMSERAGPLVSSLLPPPGSASRSCGRSRPPSTASGWPGPPPWPPTWPTAASWPPAWRWSGPAT